jgi:hypothetical protein
MGREGTMLPKSSPSRPQWLISRSPRSLHTSEKMISRCRPEPGAPHRRRPSSRWSRTERAAGQVRVHLPTMRATLAPTGVDRRAPGRHPADTAPTARPAPTALSPRQRGIPRPWSACSASKTQFAVFVPRQGQPQSRVCRLLDAVRVPRRPRPIPEPAREDELTEARTRSARGDLGLLPPSGRRQRQVYRARDRRRM